MTAPLYQPLDEGQTRVLIPAIAEDDTPSFSLEVINLANPPRYHAISYTWTQVDKNVDLRLNDTVVQVTQEVHDALMTVIFSIGAIEPLWIDCICISQQDLDEKARQVQEMHRVFGNAANIRVWLPRKDDNVEFVIEKMPILCKRLDDAREYLSSTTNPVMSELVKRGIPPLGDIIWSALEALISRRWWFRVWCLQEACLVEDTFLICELSHCKLDDCLSALFKLNHVLMHAGVDKLLDLTSDTFFNALDVYHRRNSQRKGRNNYMTRMNFRQCFNPLDYVYGSRGLVDDELRSMVKVDYSTTNNSEYWRVWIANAQAILSSKDEHYDLLEQTPSEIPHSHLPSWCQNLASTPSTGILHTPSGGLESNPIADATFTSVDLAAGVTGDWHPVSFPDLGVLRVEGVIVDEIDTVYGGLHPFQDWKKWNHNTPRSECDAWLTACWSLCNDLHSETGDYAVTRAFWFSLVGLNDSDDNKYPSASYDKARAILNRTHDSHDQEDLIEAVWVRNNVARVWSNRVLFRTKDGRVGVGHKSVLQGDKVCVFFTGRPCYILRQRLTNLRWQFQHAAYVYGLMSGQVFHMGERGEVFKRWFEID